MTFLDIQVVTRRRRRDVLAGSGRRTNRAAPTTPAAPPAAMSASSSDFNDGFDVTAPPVLHGVPFAGRARFSILSHLRAAHSSGGGLLGFMTMRE